MAERGYKFLNCEHVPSMLGGRIRLASLDYYRSLEGPQWIADNTEGSHEVGLNLHYDPQSPNAPEIAQKLRTMGIRINPSEPAVFDNCFVDQLMEHQAFVFCFSIEPFETARKAMCEDAPDGFKYDSCVEIHDVTAFARWVFFTGKIDGVPMPELFQESHASKVYYEKKTLEFATYDGMGIDPFVKHEAFSYQQEFRFFFVPKQPMDPFLFVDFCVPPGLLSVRSVTKRPYPIR